MDLVEPLGGPARTEVVTVHVRRLHEGFGGATPERVKGGISLVRLARGDQSALPFEEAPGSFRVFLECLRAGQVLGLEPDLLEEAVVLPGELAGSPVGGDSR